MKLLTMSSTDVFDRCLRHRCRIKVSSAKSECMARLRPAYRASTGTNTAQTELPRKWRASPRACTEGSN
eukprot:9498497-Pyramimonas_sp.AAC.1